MTGYQNRNINHKELVELLCQIIKSNDKTIEYIQSSLRSALAIIKKGGHVTMIYKDQKFSLRYDNRRLIIDNLNVLDTYSNLLFERLQSKSSEGLFDSKPFLDVSMCKNIRYISNKHRKTEYNRQTTTSISTVYKAYNELAIRNFVKILLNSPEIYPKITEKLNTYDKIITFIHDYNPKYKISKSSISNLKHRKMIFKQLPKNKETLKFFEYVKKHFDDFDESIFYQK
jgi:hypothetical protein